MKHLILALLAALLCSHVNIAHAQEPTPDPGFEMPYDFQPVDYESGEENPALAGLGDMIVSVPFLNRFGSIAVTVWDMLDNFAGGGVLGYFVIILLGIVVIKWIAGYVYNKPIRGDVLDLSEGFQMSANVIEQYDKMTLEAEKAKIKALQSLADDFGIESAAFEAGRRQKRRDRITAFGKSARKIGSSSIFNVPKIPRRPRF